MVGAGLPGHTDGPYVNSMNTRTGLAGADLFFADDKPENIAAAQARGWRGHVVDAVEGAEGLARAMRAAGLAV